jgi:hypothetical protein
MQRVRPRQGGRGTRASDFFSRIGDYTILFGCMALTLIVLFALPKAGMRNIYGHTNVAIARVFALNNFVVPAFNRPPAPPPAEPIFRQEMTMSPSELLDRWKPLVAEASHRVGISQAWIRAVMRIESGGRTVQAGDQPITSRAGAMGLMQLMHGTYREMRAEYGLGADPFNPHDNVIAGAAYLKWLYRKYGFPNMFAAYNDGPGKLDDHLQNGAPLPDETVNYLASVTRILGVADADLGHGRHHRNLAAYASLLPQDGIPVGPRNHRHLNAYASLLPHRGRRLPATTGG